jgi:sporulation protein YlmC with PRC-barrel domain
MTIDGSRVANAGTELPRLLMLSELIGRGVTDWEGRHVGRLRDIGVSVNGATPRVSGFYTRDRRSSHVIRTAVNVERIGLIAPRFATGSSELLLARDVLDRQVYDAAGRRLTRVGDVLLDLGPDGLAVVAGIDTGLRAILRRLGLGRGSSRRPFMVAWSDLHLLSGPGHELQLRSPAAAVHRLDDAQLVELLRRASIGQGEAVLATLHGERRSDVGNAAARSVPRRRSSDPLTARKHAPA